MDRFTKIHLNSLAIYVFYFIAISLFYIQFPWLNAILGNVDAWANIAVFHDLLNWFEMAHFTQQQASFLYPTSTPWVFYGLDFLTGVVWIFYYKLGFSDINAYWLYLMTLLSLNSFSLYALGMFFFSRKSTAFFVGLLFSLNPIVYANIDNPNVLSYVFFFFSLYAILCFSKNGNKRFLIYAAIFCGLQIYASPVVFVFTSIFITVYLLFNLLNKLLIVYSWSLLGVIIFFLIIWPYLHWYVLSPLPCYSVQEIVGSQAQIFSDRYLSLDFYDLFRYWPFYLIHNKFHLFEANLSPFISLKNVAIGFPLLAFFMASFFLKQVRNKFKWIYVVLFIYVVLAFSKYIIMDDNMVLVNPFYALLERIHLTDFVRVSSRFGVPIFLCILILGFASLESFLKKNILSRKFYWFFLILIALNSFWFSFHEVESSDNYLTIIDAIEQEELSFEKEDVVLFLPSGLFTPEKDRREFLYMLISAKLDVKTLNGSAYCFPQSRMDIYTLLNQEDLSPENFCNLLYRYEVNKVLVINDLIADFNEEEQINITFSAPCLSNKKVIDNIEIYSLKN
jgi:hypothetical protein